MYIDVYRCIYMCIYIYIYSFSDSYKFLMRYFTLLFKYKIFEIRSLFYTYSPSQFRLLTLQMLNSHVA